jgi:hypothetical protein
VIIFSLGNIFLVHVGQPMSVARNLELEIWNAADPLPPAPSPISACTPDSLLPSSRHEGGLTPGNLGQWTDKFPAANTLGNTAKDKKTGRTLSRALVANVLYVTASSHELNQWQNYFCKF